jgi:hypothetical protein
MSCEICCDKFTQTTRKPITCPYCDYVCCMSCFKTYLLGVSSGATCMHPDCNRALSNDFISSVTPKSFHNTTYREHRAGIALSVEISLLPASQHLVENKIKARKITDEIEALRIEERSLLHRRRVISSEKYRKEAEVRHIHNRKDTVERRTFIRACPVNDCRGFLSTAWKCGTCDSYTCSECHIPKNGRDDPDHECNPDDVATATLLAKDTKPCPKCAVPIYKISGCFAPEVPIMMWDGTTKPAIDVHVGDKLVGDDGTCRSVTELISGVDRMYRVAQNQAKDYVVNSQHKLSLKLTGDRTINWFSSSKCWKMKWFDHAEKRVRIETIRETESISKEDAYADMLKHQKRVGPANTIDITVEDYLKIPESGKKEMLGFRCSGVKWEKRDVEIDPYILGMWLGDGYSNGKEFSTNDGELLQYWKSWADTNDAQVDATTNAFRYYVRRQAGSDQISNPLKDQLAKYNLVENKHLPMAYIVNDEDTRLKVLAGMIDTYGHVCHDGRRIEMVQVNDDDALSQQFAFLARSLGFAVSVTTRNAKDEVRFGKYVCNHINISGKGIDRIPTLLPRNKCSPDSGQVDLIRTTIGVTQVEEGEFYGWCTDGNRRFLLGDFTVGHNCDQMWCTSCMTQFSWSKGNIIDGHNHNPHYYQWIRERNNGTVPRTPGDGAPFCGNNNLPDYHTLRAMVESRGDQFPDLGEAHRQIRHIQYIVMPRYPAAGGVLDNSDLRVSYLSGEISQVVMRSQLQMRIKRGEKNTEIHQVLDMFVNTISDIFRSYFVCSLDVTENSLCDQATALRTYANRQLESIAKRYNNGTPRIHWG